MKLAFRVDLLEQADGSALIVIVNTGGAVSPLPCIKILPDAYAPDPVTPTPSMPPGTFAAYQYKNLATGALMPYATAIGVPTQTVYFPALDAVLFQSADTAIQIQRNVDLEATVQTDEAFVFTTPPVGFATPIMPLIRQAAFNLAALDPPVPSPASVSAYLIPFFQQLLGGDGASYVITQRCQRRTWRKASCRWTATAGR